MMNKNRIKKLTAGILLFVGLIGQACAQTSANKGYTLSIGKGRVGKEDAKTVWFVPTILTNTTQDTLYYVSMFCSWMELYSVDNKKLKPAAQICDKNFPVMRTLAPHESEKVEIQLLVDQDKGETEIKFKIGFYLLKIKKSDQLISYVNQVISDKNLIWSNVISM